MASKRPSKTKRKPKARSEPGSQPLSNAKHELFAHIYSGHHNAELFGNVTQCYSLAYGYTDKINATREAIESLMERQEAGYTVKVKAHEAAIRRMKNLCAVEGARILIKPHVRERCDYILRSLITNDFADQELQYVIAQRSDLQAKVQAIKEHNRVKARVSDKLEGNFTFSWESTPK